MVQPVDEHEHRHEATDLRQRAAFARQRALALAGAPDSRGSRIVAQHLGPGSRLDDFIAEGVPLGFVLRSLAEAGLRLAQEYGTETLGPEAFLVALGRMMSCVPDVHDHPGMLEHCLGLVRIAYHWDEDAEGIPRPVGAAAE